MYCTAFLPANVHHVLHCTAFPPAIVHHVLRRSSSSHCRCTTTGLHTPLAPRLVPTEYGLPGNRTTGHTRQAIVRPDLLDTWSHMVTLTGRRHSSPTTPQAAIINNTDRRKKNFFTRTRPTGPSKLSETQNVSCKPIIGLVPVHQAAHHRQYIRQFTIGSTP